MASLTRFNEKAAERGGNPQFRAIALTIHGVNTTGGWQKRMDTLFAMRGLLPVAVDYGFMRLKLVVPGRLLRLAKERLWQRYQENHREELPYCAVAHSFGTLALGTLIATNRDARFDKVILAGSILPREYAWSSHIDSGQVRGVLNEISSNDLPVGICHGLKVVNPFIKVGRSGRYGFSTEHANLEQRTHELGHSGVLNDVACRSKWIPFLLDEPYVHL